MAKTYLFSRRNRYLKDAVIVIVKYRNGGFYDAHGKQPAIFVWQFAGFVVSRANKGSCATRQKAPGNFTPRRQVQYPFRLCFSWGRYGISYEEI